MFQQSGLETCNLIQQMGYSWTLGMYVHSALTMPHANATDSTLQRQQCRKYKRIKNNFQGLMIQMSVLKIIWPKVKFLKNSYERFSDVTYIIFYQYPLMILLTHFPPQTLVKIPPCSRVEKHSYAILPSEPAHTQ